MFKAKGHIITNNALESDFLLQVRVHSDGCMCRECVSMFIHMCWLQRVRTESVWVKPNVGHYELIHAWGRHVTHQHQSVWIYSTADIIRKSTRRLCPPLGQTVGKKNCTFLLMSRNCSRSPFKCTLFGLIWNNCFEYCNNNATCSYFDTVRFWKYKEAQGSRQASTH